ncbi:toll/interleukin-1 receptor domain-containing protein [Paenibacillus nicotianae]|uniref:Toll/interleukin-1 receptor domain-containing protein n=1 Tax=Paenibacillus nicotianae TaxID=1526551 RepID=A0ABW4US89_9BACL
MRCLIIGKFIENIKSINKIQFENICKDIGRNLANNEHSLNICSPFADSADYWILKGFSEINYSSTQPVKVYFKDDKETKEELEKLEKEFNQVKIKKIACASAQEYSWLLCQLQALDDSDLIITIGGKMEGTANMLLLLAESKRKFILPITFFGGAAEKSFERQKYHLEDFLRSDLYILHETNIVEKINDLILKISHKESIRSENKLSYFISYPKARPKEADFIETLLRRRNKVVYRDERSFIAGYNVMHEIENSIRRSNIFIATWCKEYACSPWCFDELELALDLHEKGKIEIWIFNIDDTRMIPKRARNLLSFNVRSRQELEGQLLGLLKI